MTKITINGEKFGWDPGHRPMSEALAIEDGLKTTFAKWEADLQAGSARAMCGFVWLVWQRAGREVDLAAILAGEVELSRDIEFEPDEGEEGGAPAAGPTSTTPAASPSTEGGTSPRSRKSTSGRGRSGG